MANPADLILTTKERAYIRAELYPRFGCEPRIEEGIWLRTWRSGPNKDQPKIPPALQSLMDRGLLELRPTKAAIHAYFTDSGLEALRRLAADPRALNRETFGHIYQQLGLV